TGKKKSDAAKEIEFKPEVAAAASSPVKKRASRKAETAVAQAPAKKRAGSVIAKTDEPKAKAPITKGEQLDVTAEIAATEPKVELSPAFKALATPKLPELKRENRARLLMQSPGRIYF